jgi:TolB-like protein/DNA-binding winged helix-turn-helix (wHTH) protein
MDKQPLRSYLFAGFEVDAARRRIVGPDGAARPVSARAFDVLLYLIENRHRVVGKQELMEAGWPRTVVEDNNLNQAISGLRRALADTREAPRFVLTVPGRGYRFIGDIGGEEPVAPASGESRAEPVAEPAAVTTTATTAARAAPAPDLSRRGLLAAAGALGAAVAGGAWWWTAQGRPQRPSTLAVLPFKPLAGSPRDAAVELGVTELLINRLSTLPGLVVSPLSSVLRFADAGQNPLSAARELGVETVLDGHVQIHGGRVRLTVRLLDAGSGTSLWAGDFTEPLDEFFAMQDALATQLVNALAPNLPVDARRRTLRHETEDVEAWQLYANGRYHVARRSETSIRRAVEYFAAAERRDPSFALASAGLSEAWAMLAVFGIEPPVPALSRAREAAARSLAADANLAEAHIAMGQVATQLDRNLEEGRDYYRRALGLRPNLTLAHAYMALSLTMSDRNEAARASIERAQRLEPASIVCSSIGGFVRYFGRDFPEAERQLRSVVRAVPDAPLPRQFLARTLLQQGRGQDVLSLLDGRNEPAPGSFSNYGRALALAGRREEALMEVTRLEQLGARAFGVGFDLALLHLALGDRAASLSALERAVDDHSQMAGYVNVEPGLDPIRDEPRFRAVVRQLQIT